MNKHLVRGFSALTIGSALALFPLPASAEAAVAVEAPAVDIAVELKAGRDAVRPCLELMEHDADEFAGCVHYRVDLVPAPSKQAAALRRLGALWYGWFMADIHAAFALAGAEQAARQLFAEAIELQQQLKVEDQRLCPLIDAPCSRVLSRRQELGGG